MAPLVVGFDLDMTLIDSRPGVIATFDALNAEVGATIDGHAIASRLGPPLELEMAAYFQPGEIEAVCNRYRELYAAFGVVGSNLLPGAAEAVASVRALGGTTLVVTAKFEPKARRCLDHVGIEVDHVIGRRHGPQKGETLLEHRAHLYVGDTVPDVDAAHIAGAHAVGVTTGPVNAAGLRAAGAAIVMQSLLEFPTWLTGWLVSADLGAQSSVRRDRLRE